MTELPRGTMVLTRSEVAAALPMSACIAAVEETFAAHAAGSTISPGVLGVHVLHGGFHVKTAGITEPRQYFVAKVNANFPENPRRLGLPTIQGGLLLFDATNGSLLAIMDSAEITKLRTAAATAVAAKYLARRDSSVATICGCGVQARVHLEALLAVLPIKSVFAFDAVDGAALRFANEVSTRFRISVTPVSSLLGATERSDVVVTCTTSRDPFIERSNLRPGTFIAAVGADSEDKQELAPDVLSHARVVVDVLEQCALIGELHHALDAGVMVRDQVHGELSDVVSGRRGGRSDAAEITVFDSTGTALEDVAAASVVYEHSVAARRGRFVDFAS